MDVPQVLLVFNIQSSIVNSQLSISVPCPSGQCLSKKQEEYVKNEELTQCFYFWKGKKQKQDPANPVNPVKKEKSLAEKTIEDVLLHFGETKKVARRIYRQFVEKGIKQGWREDLQGGGLVRPACHARDVNIWKQKNSRIVQTMLERQVAGKARAGRSAGGDKRGLLGRKKKSVTRPTRLRLPMAGVEREINEFWGVGILLLMS